MSEGRKFIVSTRPHAKFSEPDPECCFDLINIPVTEFSHITFSDSDISRINAFDPQVVVFTSSRGSEIFLGEILPGLDKKERCYYGIGPGTCASLEKRGFSCSHPSDRTSVGLAEFIAQRERDRRVLLFRSGQANRVMEKILSSRNVSYLSVTAYNVVPVDNIPLEILRGPDCFGIIFTSAMEVQSLFGSRTNLMKFASDNLKLFSIGPVTSARIEKFGLKVSEPRGNSEFNELFRKICREYC